MTMLTKPDPAAPYQVLDPCLLGRPVHLLPVFASQLREDLAAALRLPMNRRYWGGYQIEAVAFGRIDGSEAAGRWLGFSVSPGQIAFSLERKVLLNVLNYRYGRSAKGVVQPDPATVRVTATEERLAVVLGQQLAATVAMRVRANLASMSKSAAGAIPDLKPLPAAQPLRGTWAITVSLSETDGGERGQFWFTVDKAIMADVLHGLLPERAAKKATKGAGVPLAARLQLTLSGRMVSKEVQLGSLFDLRVGDVIPISLSRTDVLLDDARLFTAAVSEHKGKLCLTSFEDAD